MSDHANLQLVCDQIVVILCKGKLNRRAVLISSDEKNDIHVDRICIKINPFYFTQGNPVEVVRHALAVAEEYDAEWKRRTLSAIHDAKRYVLVGLSLLRKLAPEDIPSLLEDALREDDEVVHLDEEALDG